MRQRWRTLIRGDGEEHIASPNPDEAFSVWMLGALWALACLGLGYLGGIWIVPGVLIAGLLALWGWRHMEWLWWFPVVLVVATLVEPLSPLTLRSRFGPLVYVDLLAMAVALVALVRSIGLGMPLLPRTAVDRLMIVILAVLGVELVFSADHPSLLIDAKRLVVSGIVFYAATTVASRPRGSRWIWTAFPLTSVVIGGHALWSLTQPAGTLARHAHVADVVWDSSFGVVNVLAVALPVTAALAMDAGRRSARLVWTIAALLGAIALPMHLHSAIGGTAMPHLPSQPVSFEIARMVLAFITLISFARLAWLARLSRPHERPRWLALTLIFGALALLDLILPAVSGPVIPLLAVAAGLAAGTLRSDRRAKRSGRRIGPPPEPAERHERRAA